MGGDREYRAFGAYLGEMTVIPLEAKNAPSGSILDCTIFGLQAFTKEVIYVVHTPASAFGTVNNHYQLLLPRALIETENKKINDLNWKNDGTEQIIFPKFSDTVPQDFLHKRISTPQEWLSYFESGLSTQSALVFNEMWNNSSVMQDYFAGEIVNFGTTRVNTDMRKISAEEWIDLFKKAVKFSNDPVIQAMQSCINLMTDLEMLNSILTKLADSNDEAEKLKSIINKRKEKLEKLNNLLGGNGDRNKKWSGEKANFGNDVREITSKECWIILKAY